MGYGGYLLRYGVSMAGYGGLLVVYGGSLLVQYIMAHWWDIIVRCWDMLAH